MAVAYDQRRYAAKSKRKDAWEYRLIFVLSFCAFFAVAMLQRLLPRNWRTGADAKSGKSLFRQAKDAAATSVPYAFMG